MQDIYRDIITQINVNTIKKDIGSSIKKTVFLPLLCPILLPLQCSLLYIPHFVKDNFIHRTPTITVISCGRK